MLVEPIVTSNQHREQDSICLAVAAMSEKRQASHTSKASEDADFTFVDFLKNIQLFIQSGRPLDTSSNSVLYRNLNFLRDKYHAFVGKNDEPRVRGAMSPEAEIVSDAYPMLH